MRPSVFALIVATALPAVAPAAPVHQVLATNAPAVLTKLKEKGYTTVGVLRFVRPDKDGDRDDLGELGHTLAARVRQALFMAVDDKAELMVLKADPHQEAKNRTGASLLTADGRKKFFGVSYPAPFGADEKVKAKAFVAGTAAVSDDHKTLVLKLRVCGPDGELADLTDDLPVDFDPRLRGEAGESYAVPTEKRKALVSGGEEAAEVVQAAAAETMKVVAGPVVPKTPDAPAPKRRNPALDDSPIRWRVFYGKEEQTPDGDRLPEPTDEVKVWFELYNDSSDDYAAVLLVNGENSLGKERLPVARCRKWVLPAGSKTTVVGFQMDDKLAAEFTAVPPDDARADGVRGLPDLGLFRLVVFAGKEGTPPAKQSGQLSNTEVIARTRLGGPPPATRPESRQAAQQEDVDTVALALNSRGVVVGGKTTESQTKTVSFVLTSENPVADITLRYYHPKK